MSILHTRINIGLSLLTFLGMVALIYFSFLEDVVPIERHQLIAAEGLGIGAKSEFVITRELCLSRKSEAEAVRAFVRVFPDEDVPDEVHEQPPMLIHLEEGCHMRSRRAPVPADLPPGDFRYVAALKFCNAIGRCQTVKLPDIAVSILGSGDRRVIRARGLS